MKKINAMETALKVILGILIFWCVFLLFAPSIEDAITNHDNDHNYDSLNNVIAILEVERDRIKDSAFGLQVEKGRIEIELNKSQAEVKRLSSQTKQAKANKDTPAYVQNCDSLIAELEARYIPIVDTLREVDYGIINIMDAEIGTVDTLLQVTNAIKYRLKDDLFKERAQNDLLRNGLRSQKKRGPWLVAGGFVAGVLTAIFITK